MTTDLLAHLNPEQRQAVTWFDSPLLIVAGAGSGKTRVITHKIAHLIQDLGVSPFHILGVTFTNRAADEMKSRIEALTGIQSRFFHISTFHSLGLKILRESGSHADFSPDWRVSDDDEQRRIIERLAKEHFPHFSSDDRDTARRRINHAKMNLAYPNHPDLLLERGMSDEEVDLFRLYFDYQKKNRLWDYEDLISLPVKLLQSVEKSSKKYREKFSFILIDEFQDINPNQYELVRLLAGNCRNICAVGDDDQAIYSWRGASIRFLFEYERDFPGTRVIKLERNYRSTTNILDFANQLIAFNSQRKGKKMWSDSDPGHGVFLLKSRHKEEEAARTARLILALKESHPELFPLAILYRINSQSLPFETEFLKQGIPFQILKGLRFFERKEIKDSLALLRLVFDPDDDLAFLRMIDFLPLGIGEKTLEILQKKAMELSSSLFRALQSEMKDKFTQKPLFSQLVALNEMKTEHSVSELLSQLLHVSGYSQILQEKGEDERLLNIAELAEFIEKWELENPGESFHQLLDRMTLETVSRNDEFEERVFLLTMHNAKGLEFQTVVAAGINSAYMPFFLRKDRSEIEEERRLFYVAATRAMKLLILSSGSERTSPFLLSLDPMLYTRTEDTDSIIRSLSPAMETGPETDDGKRYLVHPVFGRGRIVEELAADKFVVHFSDRGNKTIDTSVIRVEFL